MAARAHGGEELKIVPLPYPIRAHTVEDNLSRAALLHLAHPLRHDASAVTRPLRVPAELPGTGAVREGLTVDAHHHTLRAEATAEDINQGRIVEGGGVDGNFVGAGVQNLLRIGERADATR